MSRLVSSTRARVLTVAVSSAAVALLGLGAVPAASAAPGGQISGTVTDADGDRDQGHRGHGVRVRRDTGDFVASTTTKKDGTLLAEEAAGGRLPGGVLRRLDGTYVTEYYDDQPPSSSPTTCRGGQARPSSGIDAELARTGTISGTVTDEQGEPLPGIFIDVCTVDEDGFPVRQPDGGTTNDRGRRLPVPFIARPALRRRVHRPRRHLRQRVLRRPPRASSTATSSPSPRAVSPPAIDAELALGGHISGTVTDSEGNGLGDIEIDLAAARRRRVVELRRGVRLPDRRRRHLPDRRAARRHLAGRLRRPRGQLPLRVLRRPADVRAATNLRAARRRTTGGIDASLADAAHVRGTVTDEAGEPIEGIFVTLAAPWRTATGPTSATRRRAADGTYSIDGLRPGRLPGLVRVGR